MRWAAANFSSPEEITLLVPASSGGGDGRLPWLGRSLVIDTFNLKYSSNFSHEVGHFLGLPHNFTNAFPVPQINDLSSGSLINPETGQLGKLSDYYDLVYRETGNPACSFASNPPCYFKDSATAQTYEASLRGKEWYNGAVPVNVNNCRQGAFNQATGICTLNTVDYSNGASFLQGIAWVYPDDALPNNPSRGWNIMSYLGPCTYQFCPNNPEDDNWKYALSDSQIRQLRRVLRYDIPISDQTNFPNLSGMRPRLGQNLDRRLAKKIDVDGDGKSDYGIWQPPVSGGTGTFKVKLGTQNYTTEVARSFGVLGDVPFMADLDNDGKSDFVLFRTGGPQGVNPADVTARFVICLSTQLSCAGPWASIQLGERGDIPFVDLDMNGDGIFNEIAVFRPSNGKLYWKVAGSATLNTFDTGGAKTGLVPMFGELDGNAGSDLAFYEPTTAKWKLYLSSRNRVLSQQQFPATLVADAFGGTNAARSGSVVVRGATQASGTKGGLQVWSPDDAVWYTMYNFLGNDFTGTVSSCQWGAPTDIPVGGYLSGGSPATGNLVVLRPSTAASGQLFFVATNTDGSCSPNNWAYITHAGLTPRTMINATPRDGAGTNNLLAIDADTMTFRIYQAVNGYAFPQYTFTLGTIGAVPL